MTLQSQAWANPNPPAKQSAGRLVSSKAADQEDNRGVLTPVNRGNGVNRESHEASEQRVVVVLGIEHAGELHPSAGGVPDFDLP